ncbi:MAG: SUMF1/EgtB/PvdO family nonheme iron enzyme [Gloeomargarita sp. SKYBB_i_bin120]|nr:SUMF1/EgtB/PvdO family nonheme iron enzyme [Gloeomargarita sp. SKYG98]MCS7291370.1 SUMF1/EgtB/PvdO family nonheme iron enzyme [Gloeomargarita sp. SKYB120]MDW8176930.1 SUMF1/EgtB/PvdO family nonheme iron enzyme [Gloeomargarita sp. SKYBB_i_bin120]
MQEIEHLRQRYINCRQRTLALIAPLTDEQLTQQVHPEFSPIGWHLGHIAYTEALWLLGEPLPYPELAPIFRVDGYAKAERSRVLPPRDVLMTYVQTIREKVLATLPTITAENARLWHWVIQHEMQHQETITLLRVLQGNLTPELPRIAAPHPCLRISAGWMTVGSETIDALDNERPCHSRHIQTFTISSRPVTQQEFQEFIEAGGYQDKRWWSDAGWAWLQQEQITQPLYWQADSPYQPVCGLSYYEAEAYCRFIGKRLPTEWEWEAAAQQGLPSQGLVWEWTCSLFAPYPGFCPYPYTGYSAAYFDGQHYVLRGGSWATHPYLKRTSFRNWYLPHVRQIFAGLRWAD